MYLLRTMSSIRLTAFGPIALLFTLASQSQAVTVKEFLVPHGVRHLVTGSDGALWFVGGRFGRITTDGVVTEYDGNLDLPFAPRIVDVTRGPDGALWYADASDPIRGLIGRVTATGITAYHLPNPSPLFPRNVPVSITAGSDGALWFTMTNTSAIGRITTGGVVQLVSLPINLPGLFGAPGGGRITSAPDHALWIAGGLGGGYGSGYGIGRIPESGGSPFYFPVPISNGGITFGPDGALWLMGVCETSYLIERVSVNGNTTVFHQPPRCIPPTYQFPVPYSQIIAGPDGALWFTTGQTSIGRITTDGIVTEYTTPSGHEPTSLTAGPDGNIWFAENDRVGVILLDQTPPVVTAQITGTQGNNGWYRSTVTVSWSVTDPESGIASSSGCGASVLTADTPGVTLTCSATNGAELSNSASVTVKIDQTPPFISGLPAPGYTLWPPNHKMVQVATITASDALSGLVPGSLRVTATSNEPAASDGPDTIVTPTGTGGFIVQFRAERSADGNGRIYTIMATASDWAGNTITLQEYCIVPHDQGK
jgi:virginiamycin B lyase